jgi:8-oxo-dGTP diphosphatase
MDDMSAPSACQVIAAIIQRNGQYLLCQRPPHKRHGQLWEFPGGKLEAGETLMDAAQRELREELGLTVTGIGEVQLAIKDPGSPFVVNFVPVTTEGEPEAIEHVALGWFAINDLLKVPLAPSDHKFAIYLKSRTEADGSLSQ